MGTVKGIFLWSKVKLQGFDVKALICQSTGVHSFDKANPQFDIKALKLWGHRLSIQHSLLPFDCFPCPSYLPCPNFMRNDAGNCRDKLQSTIQSFSPMAHFLPSSSSSSSAPPPTSSSIDLTSSQPPTITTSALTSQKSSKTSYVWDYGTELIGTIFELTKADFVVSRSELEFWSHSVMESEWNGISDIGKDDIWAIFYPINVNQSGESV